VFKNTNILNCSWFFFKQRTSNQCNTGKLL